MVVIALVGLATERLAIPLLCNNYRQFIRTHVLLSASSISWCGVMDLQLIGRRFESRPLRFLCLPSSINLYRRELGAKQALHATHWPHVHGLAASAGVWLRVMETEMSAALWAFVAREGL